MTEPRLVVLIGAARSGTKLVRDCVGAHPDASPVPYDVNFLWRLGNESHPHDELDPNQANVEVRRRIARHLQRWWKQPVLVEKSVSNALRVPFVDRLFPDARYIHLIRDGYDVVESSYRQWLAPPDWRYLTQKFRAFPPSVAPRYVARFGKDTVARVLSRSGERSLPVWGPAYEGIHEDLREIGTLATCARQWRRCVELAQAGLAEVPAERKTEIRYEDFVADPAGHLESLTKFVGLDPGAIRPDELEVRTSERGKGKASLSSQQLDLVAGEIGPLQRALGYE